jgi:hypothetical protein
MCPQHPSDQCEHSDHSDHSDHAAAHLPGPAATLVPPFPLTPPVAERVALALAVMERTDDAGVRELCGAIGACAAELHAQGMAWEAALPTMEAFVRHTAAARAPIGNPSARWVGDAFMAQMDRWCLDAYCRCHCKPAAPGADT